MKKITQAVHCLTTGGVIAYPTEGVYGLGCDPFNEKAVMRILQLKQRPVEKGLILIAASWQQLEPLVLPYDDKRMQMIFNSWPGPFTWVFRAKPIVPHWIKGQHETIAVRVSAHPLVVELCQAFGGPLVSTSANRHQQPAAKTRADVDHIFAQDIDYILQGSVGGLDKPTEIRDGLTGDIIRG